MNRSELIAKLEAATEGSRELNEAIVRCQQNKYDTDRYRSTYDHDYGFCLYDEAEGEYIPVPDYTTSIDAPLPGEKITLVQWINGKWEAYNEMPKGWSSCGTANTEPLARRIAALKAMEAQPKPAPLTKDRYGTI